MSDRIEEASAEWRAQPPAWPQRDRPVCAWCHEPIVEEEYYRIDREPVCRECVDACKSTAPSGRDA